MTNVLVAVHAGQTFIISIGVTDLIDECALAQGFILSVSMRADVMNEALMTAQAIILQDTAASLLNADRFNEVLSGEFLTVAPAIFGFGKIFRNERVRQMAIDANGDRVMAAVLPAVVLGLHDVAVDASFGIGTQVG